MREAVISVVATNLVVGVYRPDDGINTGKKRKYIRVFIIFLWWWCKRTEGKIMEHLVKWRNREWDGRREEEGKRRREEEGNREIIRCSLSLTSFFLSMLLHHILISYIQSVVFRQTHLLSSWRWWWWCFPDVFHSIFIRFGLFFLWMHLCLFFSLVFLFSLGLILSFICLFFLDIFFAFITRDVMRILLLLLQSQVCCKSCCCWMKK